MNLDSKSSGFNEDNAAYISLGEIEDLGDSDQVLGDSENVTESEETTSSGSGGSSGGGGGGGSSSGGDADADPSSSETSEGQSSETE